MERPFEVVGVGVEEPSEDADHHVVHPEVDRPELGFDAVGRGLEGLALGDVHQHRQPPASRCLDLGDRGVDTVLPAGEDRDVPPPGGELAHRRPSESSRTTGHHCHTSHDPVVPTPVPCPTQFAVPRSVPTATRMMAGGPRHGGEAAGGMETRHEDPTAGLEPRSAPADAAVIDVVGAATAQSIGWFADVCSGSWRPHVVGGPGCDPRRGPRRRGRAGGRGRPSGLVRAAAPSGA